MWQLSPEQTAALVALKRARDLRRLGATLAAAFPTVAQRAGERYEELISLGATRGEAQGLSHLLALARYLACWFVLGAEFEAKPSFAWARDLLAAPRPQGAKVFQLCRRCRESLPRTAQSPETIAAAAFDAALAQLDEALKLAGTLGSLLPGELLRLGEACDIDAVDVRLAEQAAPQLYRVEQGQWRRVPVVNPQPGVTLAVADPPAAEAPQLPERLSVLSPSSAASGARLRVRTRSGACCDPEVHPLVTHGSVQGSTDWRGRQAHDVMLNLPAPTSPLGEGALQPVIAWESAPEFSQLSLSSCGLRDNGAALGTLQTVVSAYPSDQHLMAWRREAWPPMAWPESTAANPPPPASRLRIERDGTAADASRWLQGFEELDRQLAAGLAKLQAGWRRESGVEQDKLQAVPQLLCGNAALTWGWADGAQGLASAPFFRVAGMLDLVACQLDLRFSGTLALRGSQSRLTLHGAGTTPLKMNWERQPAHADLGLLLEAAKIEFRMPFVLELEALAQAERVVANAAGPVQGTLVGGCGLRARAEGTGLEWFAKLAVEPVSVVLQLHDPLLGLQTVRRSLLPATTLLDWSLG